MKAVNLSLLLVSSPDVSSNKYCLMYARPFELDWQESMKALTVCLSWAEAIPATMRPRHSLHSDGRLSRVMCRYVEYNIARTLKSVLFMVVAVEQ